MKRVGLYARALRLYPADYYARFGREMLSAYVETCRDCSSPLARARAEAHELAGLANGIVREWITKLTQDQAERGRVLPDCRMMRPIGVTRRQWAAGLDGY